MSKEALRTLRIGVRVRHERYKRESSGMVLLSVPAVTSGCHGSWLRLLVQELADQSVGAPRSESKVGRLTHALSAICSEPNLEIVWHRKLGDLTRDDLDALFIEVESRLASNVALSASLRYHASLQFRQICQMLIPRLRADLRLEGLKFRSRFRTNPQPRSLISDQVVNGSAPQGAIPYEDPRELKKKMLNASLNILEKVKHCAAEDIAKADQLRIFLSQLKSDLKDDKYIDLVHRATCTQKYTKHNYKLFKDDDEKRYVGALIHLYDRENWAAKGSAPGVLYGKKVNQYLLAEINWKVNLKSVWKIRSFATLQEIHACVTILQIVSSWNISSVLELRLEDIVRVKNGYVIQSFKTKTDTHTPPVKLTDVIEAPTRAHDVSAANDPEACRALELLIWNHYQLVDYGHQDENDTRLINSAFATTNQPGTLTVQHFQEQFITRHALPKFSPEQLRNESLFATSLGSLSKANRDAGHKSISITGNYIRQLVANRLHSSQNLQFQRNLAIELHELQSKNVDHSELELLRPIGDGASCKDPASHPWLDVLETECQGDRCHANGGCVNRVLQVTHQRLKEALLTERVYEENWPELCDQNPAAFYEYDIPRIIFVKGFLHMTSQSTMGHVVSKLRRELQQKNT